MGYRIKEIREERGISQSKLAELTGITRTTLWRLENGEEETTTTKTLLKIANALGVTISELFLPQSV